MLSDSVNSRYLVGGMCQLFLHVFCCRVLTEQMPIEKGSLNWSAVQPGDNQFSPVPSMGEGMIRTLTGQLILHASIQS